MVVITEGWGRWDDGKGSTMATREGEESGGVRGPRGDAQCLVLVYRGKVEEWLRLAVSHARFMGVTVKYHQHTRVQGVKGQDLNLKLSKKSGW